MRREENLMTCFPVPRKKRFLEEMVTWYFFCLRFVGFIIPERTAVALKIQSIS